MSGAAPTRKSDRELRRPNPRERARKIETRLQDEVVERGDIGFFIILSFGVTFLFYDLLTGPERLVELVVVHLARLFGLTAVYLASRLFERKRARSAFVLTGFTIAILAYVATGVLRDEASAHGLYCVVLTLGCAALLPWGWASQAIAATIASAGVFVLLLVPGGTIFDPALFRSWLSMALVMAVSVWMAEQVQVARRVSLVAEIEAGELAADRRRWRRIMRIMMDYLPVVMWTTDRDLRINFFLGKEGRRGESLAPASTAPVPLTALLEEAASDPEGNPVRAHLRALHGEPVSYELFWAGAHYRTRVEPLRDESGAIQEVVGVSLNISETRRAEERAAEAWRILDESANELLLVEPETYAILNANQAARRNLGYALDRISEISLHEVWPRLDKAAIDDLVRPVAEQRLERVQFEVEMQRRDRSYYPVNVLLWNSTFEGVPIYVVMARDLSETRQLEAEIADLRSRAGKRAGGGLGES
jgi:PAS domain S-box-containing protein